MVGGFFSVLVCDLSDIEKCFNNFFLFHRMATKGESVKTEVKVSVFIIC